MNISRGVLHRKDYGNRILEPLHTWVDVAGFTWFGVDRVSFGYAYVNRNDHMHMYSPYKRGWLNVNQLYNPWGPIP